MKRILMIVGILGLGGCSMMGRNCDESSLAAATSHTSHLTAGPPFGAKKEEDSLDTVGLVGRCTHGPAYIEMGMGYKFREGGFYGPDEIFNVSVGVTLWDSKR